MNERVAAVDQKPSAEDIGGTGPGGTREPKSRFAYATGSKPLEGYTIKRGIGHGGFGEVYFATSDAGKEVALKLIRRNFEVELRGIKHCLNLKHPNLLSIFDLREDKSGDKWVVMEYVSGNRLEEVVADNPNGMPLQQTLAWFYGICSGVGYLHNHGIVHRDLKPGNIFSDEGMVKIGDYGLSKFISCSRRSGQTESVGTVHYMAPEVANGRYGKQIDVYALGVMLYEMLTGRVPFEGESVGEVLMKHLTAKPDVSMLAEPYRSVVAQALEKDPDKRFQNVSEMLAALPKPIGDSAWPSGVEAAAAGTVAGASQADFVQAEAVDEEPVMRMIRNFCHRIHMAWSESNLDTPTKIVLLLLALIVLLPTAGGWLPLALTLAGLYGCYWVMRWFILSMTPAYRHNKYFSADREPALKAGVPPGQHPPKTPPSPNPAAPSQAKQQATHGQRRHQGLPKWARRERPADALVIKSKRERLAELFGSMLGGGFVSVTMCFVLLMLNSFRTGVLPPIEVCSWLALVSIIGTWAVLIPGKFWEGNRGEAMVRRFVLMVVGLAIGGFAAAAALFLKIDLPYDHQFSEPHSLGLPAAFYDAHGTPMLMAYMACFGTLFLLVRWWRQADPLRTSRMSLWSMVFSVVAAWLVATLWLFPQPWLMMAACAISVSVQLSSPWLHPRSRPRRVSYD